MSAALNEPAPPRGPVLLFDGECGLCALLVRWLQRRPTGHRVAYLPLQATLAQDYLVAQGLPTRDFDSLVFAPDGLGPQAALHLLRTDGLFAALRVIGGPVSLLAMLRVIPRPMRDGLYACVARLRHGWRRRRG